MDTEVYVQTNFAESGWYHTYWNSKNLETVTKDNDLKATQFLSVQAAKHKIKCDVNFMVRNGDADILPNYQYRIISNTVFKPIPALDTMRDILKNKQKEKKNEH